MLRDIRSDLQERLDRLTAERLQLQTKLAALESLEATFKTALREEEVRVSRLSADRPQLPLSDPDPEAASPAYAFIGSAIKSLMKSKNRPLAKDEIRDELVKTKTYDFGQRKPGRSVHFGLMSLVNGGDVDQLPDGRFVISSKNGFSVQEVRTTH